MGDGMNPNFEDDLLHLTLNEHGEPKLPRPYHLTFVGDWGGANFHRICSWLTQEFCDRAGPGSRTSIRSIRDGGLDSLLQLHDGEVDLVISTPAALLGKALTGEPPFPKPMPRLRALAALPQNDRMVFALSPSHGQIETFSDLRQRKPPLRLATSTNDGTNLIGYTANQFLTAHGISPATITSWGGTVITAHRPEQCVAYVQNGQADALLQEAIMTPWWRSLTEAGKLIPLPAEPEALQTLHASLGLGSNTLPAGFWTTLTADLPALDFSDFIILVRDDMQKDLAYLLTWCLVETRHLLEGQYRHIPPEKSPLSYPLDPEKMAKTSIPLHEGAREFYEKRKRDGPQSKGGVMSPFQV